MVQWWNSFHKCGHCCVVLPSIPALSCCMCCICLSSFRFFFPDRVMFALGLDLKQKHDASKHQRWTTYSDRSVAVLWNSCISETKLLLLIPNINSNMWNIWQNINLFHRSLTFSSSGDERWWDPDRPPLPLSDVSSSSLCPELAAAWKDSYRVPMRRRQNEAETDSCLEPDLRTSPRNWPTVSR